MNGSTIFRRFMVLPLLCLLFSCRTAPRSDPTTEYRRLLAEEIGSLALPGDPPSDREGGGLSPGPAERRYREYFDIDGLLSRTGASHRMGLLEDAPPSLGVQYFLPAGKSRGTVFLAHGYLDNSGPFRPLMEVLVGAGFSLVAFDLPGHGFSGGERGDIGDFREYGAAVGRVVRAFSEASGRPGGGRVGETAFPRPWTALGHSTGAASFFIFLHDRAADGGGSPFDRVVFVNPLVRSARWRLSMAGLALFGWAVRNYPPRNEPDPLLGNYNFPLSWAESLRAWNREVGGYVPFEHRGLLIQGRRDKVVDYRYNVPFLLEKIRGLEARYVEEADHVPYTNEAANREVIRLVLAYIEKE